MSLGRKTMKRYILSPLCSAFIIPGLGQILNHNLKKGLCLLGMVFILFIAAVIKSSLIIKSLLRDSEITQSNAKLLGERLQGEDFTLLWVLLFLFAMIWMYSVLDAFWTGRKMESQGEYTDL